MAIDWDGLREKLSRQIAPNEDSDDVQKLSLTGRSNVLGTIADVLAVVTVLYSASSLILSRSVSQAVLAATLAGMTITFMIANLSMQRRYQRETQRMNAVPHLVGCHGRLREAAVSLLRGDQSAYTVHVVEAARMFATYLTHATGIPCRVAIQEVTANGPAVDDAVVTTICRSVEVEPGTREAGLAAEARVGDNTDFRIILEGRARVFFSNDLSKLRRYRNSHFDVEKPAKQYPYRSTIVWPILGPSLVNAAAPGDIAGFLSVDARPPGVFTRVLDVPTGKMIATAMYSSLSHFQAIRDAQSAIQGESEGDPDGTQ